MQYINLFIIVVIFILFQLNMILIILAVSLAAGGKDNQKYSFTYVIYHLGFLKSNSNALNFIGKNKTFLAEAWPTVLKARL